MKNMRKLMKKQDGQGMTEYIIIVALIAIAAIGVVTIFGDNIRKMFGASVNALANTSTSSTGAATASSTSQHRNVVDFASQSTVH
jgi:Flp pilus assembly pilin Flp